MKRPQFVILPIYLAGLLCMVFSWRLMISFYLQFPSLEQFSWLVHLLPGVLLMICALGFHGANRRSSFKYVISFFLNTAAYGVTICALTGPLSLSPIENMLTALIPAAILACALCFLLLIPGKTWNNILRVVFPVLSVGLMGFGIYRFSVSPEILTIIFTSLFSFVFSICCAKLVTEPNEAFHYLSYTGLGAFALIAFFVVLFANDPSSSYIFNGFNNTPPSGRKKNWKQEMAKRKKK